jgi:integrase
MGRAASGHVEQLPSGSLRVEVHAGTDPLTGRRLRFRQTVKTEKQAQIVLGRLLDQASAGQLPDSGVTVAELMARYMEVAELDVSTRETYEGYLRRTILPALGSMELRKLRGLCWTCSMRGSAAAGTLPAPADRSPSTDISQR